VTALAFLKETAVPNVIDLIVFTPKEYSAHGHALKNRIQSLASGEGLLITATTWDEDESFFSHENKFPMNECIRKLHSFDGAVLILGPGAPRPAGNALSDWGNTIAWRFRRLFGLPEPVNSNVLIEIGASMARFGRNRVFLIEPKGKSVEVPSYFRENNALFFTYDDGASDPDAAMAGCAGPIVSKLKELGHAVYYSDLPSFGLAHGYLQALIRPIIENVESGVQVAIEGETRSFKKALFILAYSKARVATRPTANHLYEKLGLAEALVKAKDGRTISFRTLPGAQQTDTLVIIDIPTNLIPSLHAIDKIEDLWIGGEAPGAAYKEKLERREIANFFRYLDILREDNKIDAGKLRLLEVENFEDLTLDAIRARAS
jgi:hypothetical protein